jgi:sirohydrochlorin cobaltochelatase
MGLTKIAVQACATAGVLILLNGCAATDPVERGENYILLVGHGIPASDYPKERLREFFRMHWDDHAEGAGIHEHGLSERDIRDKEIREWPRTPENDPYKYGVEAIAKRLEDRTGRPVLVAYNEFCAPTVEQAVEDAIARGAKRIVVVPTMMTPGGGHSEEDIPKSIAASVKKHPNIQVVYAWPFEVDRIASTLSDHVERFGISGAH